MSTLLEKHYKSPFPEIKLYSCDKPVATDTMDYDTPAIDDGLHAPSYLLAKSCWFHIYRV